MFLLLFVGIQSELLKNALNSNTSRGEKDFRFFYTYYHCRKSKVLFHIRCDTFANPDQYALEILPPFAIKKNNQIVDRKCVSMSKSAHQLTPTSNESNHFTIIDTLNDNIISSIIFSADWYHLSIALNRILPQIANGGRTFSFSWWLCHHDMPVSDTRHHKTIKFYCIRYQFNQCERIMVLSYSCDLPFANFRFFLHHIVHTHTHIVKGNLCPKTLIWHRIAKKFCGHKQNEQKKKTYPNLLNAIKYRLLLTGFFFLLLLIIFHVVDEFHFGCTYAVLRKQCHMCCYSIELG